MKISGTFNRTYHLDDLLPGITAPGNVVYISQVRSRVKQILCIRIQPGRYTKKSIIVFDRSSGTDGNIPHGCIVICKDHILFQLIAVHPADRLSV